jgi:hypothetical protein
MTDIVERLRKFYGDDTDNWLDADEAEPVMLEAADEIERLRAALQNIATGVGERVLSQVEMRNLAFDALQVI